MKNPTCNYSAKDAARLVYVTWIADCERNLRPTGRPFLAPTAGRPPARKIADRIRDQI